MREKCADYQTHIATKAFDSFGWDVTQLLVSEPGCYVMTGAKKGRELQMSDEPYSLDPHSP